MIMQDKLEKERNDAKNNVEEYVYDMREKLHSVLEKFVNDAVSIDHVNRHLNKSDNTACVSCFVPLTFFVNCEFNPVSCITCRIVTHSH